MPVIRLRGPRGKRKKRTARRSTPSPAPTVCWRESSRARSARERTWGFRVARTGSRRRTSHDARRPPGEHPGRARAAPRHRRSMEDVRNMWWATRPCRWTGRTSTRSSLADSSSCITSTSRSASSRCTRWNYRRAGRRRHRLSRTLVRQRRPHGSDAGDDRPGRRLSLPRRPRRRSGRATDGWAHGSRSLAACCRGRSGVHEGDLGTVGGRYPLGTVDAESSSCVSRSVRRHIVAASLQIEAESRAG